jgi:hypothetical protein
MQHAVAQQLRVDASMVCKEKEHKHPQINGHALHSTAYMWRRRQPVLLQKDVPHTRNRAWCAHPRVCESCRRCVSARI